MSEARLAPASFGAISSPGSARAWSVGLLTLAVIVALLNLWVMSTWQRVLDPHLRGTLLAKFDLAEAGGWQRIAELDPDSPLQAAGAAVGDAVRWSRRGEAWLRLFGTDERIEVELRSGGGSRALSVEPVQEPGFVPARIIPVYVSEWLARWLALLIGALLAFRRSDSPAVRGLALSLILSFPGYSLPSGDVREQGVVWLWPFLEDISSMGGVWFAFHVQEDRPIWKRTSVALVIVALFSMLMVPLLRWSLQWRLGYDAKVWSSVPGLDWFSGFQGYTTTGMVVNATTAVALWSSWRRADGATRVRIAWIAVALGVPLLWDTFSGFLRQVLSSQYGYPATWFSIASVYITLAGTMMLGWAVLRRRVFDFGLVVQRALAFSMVSTALLAVIGIGKWLTETLLQTASHERSFFHDAAMTVAVVIAFAVLQQRITKYVTRVFFSKWHKAAESLRGFVERSAHMSDADSIKRQFVAAIDEFTEGQGSAFYSADATANLHLEHGTLAEAPRLVHPNEELAVKLRESARRVDLSRLHERMAGDWAFPMVVSGNVVGALLIGARTEGVAYRPEELTQLTDSARIIGLNLESLRAADLQRKHDELAKRLGELEQANTSLAADNARLKGAAS